MSNKNPLQLRKEDDAGKAEAPFTHVYGKGHRCVTDLRGYKTPGNSSLTKLKIDTHEGFIP
jgi:hypothetical protein